MANRKPLIVYVDRLTQFTHHYVMALAKHFKLQHFQTFPEAISFILNNRQKISLVIIEPMMPHGHEFEKDQTEQGILGGVPFSNLLTSLYPESLRQVILTNLCVAKNNRKAKATETEYVIVGNHVTVLSKKETQPLDLVQHVKDCLKTSVCHQHLLKDALIG